MTYDMRIDRVLQELGVTKTYKGYFQIALALQLCLEEPDRLSSVTNLLYPDVAKQFHTKWRSVERNIRTVINVIWTQRRSSLETINHHGLTQKPCAGELLSILLNHIVSTQDALPDLYRDVPCELYFPGTAVGSIAVEMSETA